MGERKSREKDAVGILYDVTQKAKHSGSEIVEMLKGCRLNHMTLPIFNFFDL